MFSSYQCTSRRTLSLCPSDQVSKLDIKKTLVLGPGSGSSPQGFKTVETQKTRIEIKPAGFTYYGEKKIVSYTTKRHLVISPHLVLVTMWAVFKVTFLKADT